MTEGGTAPHVPAEPAVPAEPVDPVDPVVPRRRWRPPIIREPLVAVLVAVAVGLWLVWAHHPRKGLGTIALALAASAFLRLVLHPRDAGLLVVRSRFIDVSVLLVLAGMVVVLAVVQHFPGPGR